MFYPSLSLMKNIDDCRTWAKKRAYFVSLSRASRLRTSSSIPGFEPENHSTSIDTRRIICF